MAASAGHHYLRERAENATAVTFVELFFDLVYVFAVTQISHLLLGDLSWHGAFHAALVLLAMWQAWMYSTWRIVLSLLATLTVLGVAASDTLHGRTR